ncbi:hypothetical protein ACQZWC_004615 [Enterobacter bugandensis]
MDIVFSPVRNPGESWTECLQWLLMTDGFGFNNPLSREEAGLALDLMAEYTGWEMADSLTMKIIWNYDSAGTLS